MKKALVFLLVLTAWCSGTQSQTFKFGIGPALSLPIGTFYDINSVGIGAEVTGILQFSEKFEAWGQAGYHYFTKKDIEYGGVTFEGESTGHVPFIFGGRYRSSNFVIGAGFGYSTFGEGASGFTFSPQLGYSSDKVDVLGHYTSTSIDGSNLAYIGLKTHFKF